MSAKLSFKMTAWSGRKARQGSCLGAVLVVCALAFVVRIAVSEFAYKQLADMCAKLRAGMSVQNDGGLFMDFSRHTLSEDQMYRLREMWSWCLSKDVFFATPPIRLNLNSAKLGGSLDILLDDSINELSLDGLAVNNAQLERIVSKCRSLRILRARGMAVDAETVTILDQSNLQSLDIVDAQITCEALTALCRSRKIGSIVVRESVCGPLEFDEIKQMHGPALIRLPRKLK